MRDAVASPITRRKALALALAVAGAPFPAERAAAAYTVRPWPSAKPVPGLDLADIDGKRWSLASFAGQVVLLNFWATWCEPCRVEMPSLEALAERYGAQGLVVVAVNYRESAAEIRSFLEHLSFKAKILLDADGDAATEWTPRVFPTSVLISRGGQPSATIMGEFDWEGAAARELIDPLLATPRKR